MPTKNESQQFLLQKELKNLSLILLISFILTALAAIAGVIKLQQLSQERLARSYTNASRNSILSRDYRQAVLSLSPALEEGFLSITVFKSDGGVLVSIPNFSKFEEDSHQILTTSSLQKVQAEMDSESTGMVTVVFNSSLIWVLFGVLAALGGTFGLFTGVFFFARRRIEERHENILRQNELATAQLVSKQISHDIRSPLAALNMMVSQLTSIPETQRLIIRNSVNRINDIAQELLSKSKPVKVSGPATSSGGGPVESKLEVQLLSPLIESLISEKRIQYREKQNIEIEAQLDNSYGVFVNINGTELKRTISNLLNNAIESFSADDSRAKGRITVSISHGTTKESSGSIRLIVQDNGKGIPKHILDKLGQVGVTHGKEGTQSGSGLGVHHAKKTIESFGGKFEIQSEENVGTTIIMTLPKVPASKWFVEKLSLVPKSQVVSLDDDISIHNIWQRRLQSINMDSFGIEHITFTSGNDFKNWVLNQQTIRNSQTSPSEKDASPSPIYLVDYKLLNQGKTGLEIIESLNIGPQSILVTSRYEEPQVRAKCEALGVRLIPKGMASYVPIEIQEKNK